jgi:hypothetical protein
MPKMVPEGAFARIRSPSKTRKAESTFGQMEKVIRRNFHEIGEGAAPAWIDERKSNRATSTLAS